MKRGVGSWELGVGEVGAFGFNREADGHGFR